MHHAPSGPPVSARLAAALARGRSRLLALVAVLRPGVRFVRRTRLVPVLLAAFVIGAFALAAPLPAGGRTPSDTAALTAPSGGGRELVPATGDGWTQDGRPATPAPESGAAAADEPADAGAPEAPVVEEVSPAAEPLAPSEPSVREAPSPAVPSTSSPRTRAVAPATSSQPETTAPTAPSTRSDATTSSPSPSSSPSVATSPSAPAPTPLAVEAPSGDEVLAALNAARAAEGCDPLTEDAGLAGAAADHSAAMRDQATLLPPPGAGAVAGELDDPAAAADGWLADATVPVADCTLTTAGVGVVDGWWTLLLA